MFEPLIDFLRDKNIIILGFGREGQSSYRLLRQFFPEKVLTIADARDLSQTELSDAPFVELKCGADYLSGLENYDLIFKTPGISLAKVNIDSFREHITSQLELALRFLPLKTIGITGTKGKSTTSSLIYQILQDQGIKSQLLGNIGVPIFEHFDELQPDATLVLEMSSHQLEFMRHSPNIAVLLNVYEEHLDHYVSFDAYAAAKCNIFRYQTEHDSFFYNYDSEILRHLVGKPAPQVFPVSLSGEQAAAIRRVGQQIYFGEQVIYNINSPRQLLGDYNLLNITFALSVAHLLELDMTQAAQTVNKFQTLKHRLEFVGEYEGVKYYDNSIGTVPMATIEAIKALGDVDTVLVGGMERGVNQQPLIDFLAQSNVAHVICLPETGRKIAQALPASQAILVDGLEAAVKTAKTLTAKGKSCLLSPAAASYGAFKNFEEKGARFQELVRAA